MTTLLTSAARGVYPISITPFTADGSVDDRGMDRITDFFIECGVPGVTLLGVLGEAGKLSGAESLTLVKRVLARANGALQVIVGVSQLGFDNAAEFSCAVMDAGASGIMLAPAGALRTEDQVLGYVDGLIGKIGAGVPIVLQDFPQTTGVFMSADTIGKLVERHAGIMVIKHEDAPALRKISRLRATEAASGRRRVSILVGNSAIHLPQELHRGVDGANTGVAYPEMLIETCRRFFAGDVEGAEDLYDLFLPIVRHEQQPGVGLAIRKEIFRRRGLIDCARLRAPGPALDADDHAELGRMLARLERKLRAAGELGVLRRYPVGA